MKNAFLAAAALALTIAAPAAAQAPAGDLEQRVQKLEQEAGERAAKERATPVVSAGEKGFGFRSADGAFDFKFKGLLQLDGRFFAGDEQTLNDTFLLRRLEPVFELALGKLAYLKFQPQFSGDTATTSDVYGELRFSPAATLRFGKFKTPLGLEYLQGTPAMIFVERGLPTELGAGRDFGVQLLGEAFAGTATWALAYANGTPDGRDAVSSDTDNKKEVAARLFFEPFRNEPGFFRGLGFGVAATRGDKVGAIGSAAATTATSNNTLPRYRSAGQNTIFTYLSNAAPTAANTAIAAGEHQRLSPQLYFYRGPFGLVAEHMSSEQEVSINGVPDTFEHTAWQITANVLLTGEDSSYKGIKPSAPYVTGGEGWGAFEIGLRHGVLDVDDAVFPVYSSPTASVSEATNTGVALNWYVTGNARISLDYETTSFEGGAAAGDRLDEKALFTRLQVSF
jgi:phosphate-selective porin OprO and OprP